jgi:hypothetical protein
LGFGLGAFFVSFLPLSLFPMARSLTQKAWREKSVPVSSDVPLPFAIPLPFQYDS